MVSTLNPTYYWIFLHSRVYFDLFFGFNPYILNSTRMPSRTRMLVSKVILNNKNFVHLSTDKSSLHGSTKWMWAHMKIQLVSCAVQGLFFSMEVLGFMIKVMKLGQCRNMLPLVFSAIRNKLQAIYYAHFPFS